MQPDGLIIESAPFTHALTRFAMTSKRATVDVVRQQFGLVMQNVAKFTPPASEGVTGRAAEKQGKAKVAADIRSLYGTPGDAYEAIAARSPAQASAFWMLSQSGDESAAAELVRDATGKSFVPFDNGTLHDRMMNGRRRRRSSARREHVFYVTNLKDLQAYITKEQEHVLWLASGWQDALKALGRAVPYGVNKHAAAPGTLKVKITDAIIEITAVNAVSFGMGVQGIERRIRWAMNIQTQKLDRQWDSYLKMAARQAGML